MVDNVTVEELKHIFSERTSPNEKKFSVRVDPEKFKEKFPGADIVIKYIDNNETIAFSMEGADTIQANEDFLEQIANILMEPKRKGKFFFVKSNGNGYDLDLIE